jgi:hypothetical protein
MILLLAVFQLNRRNPYSGIAIKGWSEFEGVDEYGARS